jgi:hypothetical protein
MNGRPRDQINTDLAAGRPTISPVADPLAMRTAALMSDTEQMPFFSDLENRVRRSSAFPNWIEAPTRYLADFDGHTAASIETHLADLHRRMVERAKERGWEVEDGT